jgi:Flp pilus assembly protein CpaB
VANPTAAQLGLVNPGAPNSRPAAPRASNRRVIYGLILAVAAALLIGTKYQQALRTHEVVSLARAVPVGQVLTAQDLTQTRLADNTTIPSVPASRLNDAVGKVAQAPLYPGEVLDPRALVTGSVLPAGEVALTLALSAEQAVGGSLHPGDVVAVLAGVPPAAGLPPTATEVLAAVSVHTVATQSTAGGAVTELITLELTPTQATTLDAAYRAYKIDLALVGH